MKWKKDQASSSKTNLSFDSSLLPQTCSSSKSSELDSPPEGDIERSHKEPFNQAENPSEQSGLLDDKHRPTISTLAESKDAKKQCHVTKKVQSHSSGYSCDVISTISLT